MNLARFQTPTFGRAHSGCSGEDFGECGGQSGSEGEDSREGGGRAHESGGVRGTVEAGKLARAGGGQQRNDNDECDGQQNEGETSHDELQTFGWVLP